MSNLFKFIVLSLFVFACASKLKKQCENTNWFEHGASVAKLGQRLDQDTFIQQCKKEKAPFDHSAADKGFKVGMNEYCNDSYSFIVGKRGDFLNLDLCDTALHKSMSMKHEEGVKEFCKKDNGFSFGATGKKYNDICPQNLENTFLVEYKKGRKTYIETVISQKNEERLLLEKDLRHAEQQSNQLRREATYLNDKSHFIARQHTDPQTRIEHTNDYKEQADDLQFKARQLDWDIQKKKQMQKTLTDEIQQLQKEAITLQ